MRSSTGDLYRMDTLLLLLRHGHESYSEYTTKCNDAGVPHVRRVDMYAVRARLSRLPWGCSCHIPSHRSPPPARADRARPLGCRKDIQDYLHGRSGTCSKIDSSVVVPVPQLRRHQHALKGAPAHRPASESSGADATALLHAGPSETEMAMETEPEAGGMEVAGDEEAGLGSQGERGSELRGGWPLLWRAACHDGALPAAPDARRDGKQARFAGRAWRRDD
jgi:hypothetical protein